MWGVFGGFDKKGLIFCEGFEVFESVDQERKRAKISVLVLKS